MTILIIPLVLVSIVLILVSIKFYDIKSQLKIEEKPSYSITIQAVVKNKNIVYIIKDDYEDNYYGQMSRQSKCKLRFGANSQSTFDAFKSVKEAEDYIIYILKNNMVTIDRKLDIETIQLQ